MRTSGVLLPIFSLPGKYGIGCFSKEAYAFVDFLAKAGQTYWQILPLGPTSYGDSPYQSFSTFAGNPYFIDLDQLIAKGYIRRSDVGKVDFGENDKYIDYEKLYYGRFGLLKQAYKNSNVDKDEAFHAFCGSNAYWLHDYALFMAIKDSFGGVSFYQWPEEIRKRNANALAECQEKFAEEVEYYKFIQYEFFLQWTALRDYAKEKGIQIIGDIPIYVAADSSDVWAHPELFQMDEQGRPVSVAGCPPDAFSATGQLWGNPLYAWDKHEASGFDWWIRRVKKCRELYDVIRIDHFRGFDEYYSIPAADETAENGHWEKGPGMKLFSAIEEALPGTQIIAEDLGFITDSVRGLVKDSGYPNMKVLEFAFDARDAAGASEYLPHLYNKNCVVYTGTHDNETLVSWLDNIQPEEVKMIRDYVGNSKMKKSEIPDAMIRLAQASVADLCVIPLQDYMGLGDEARINHPSTLGGNWVWRADKKAINAALAKKIFKGTKTFGRL